MSNEAPTTIARRNGEWFNGCEYEEIKQKVSVVNADTAVTVGATIPANARILFAELNAEDTVGLTTATRYALGTTADPDWLVLSGTTLTANNHALAPAMYGQTLLYASQAASTAVTNTTTPTTFDTKYSMPANSLKPGDVIRVQYQGIATSTTGATTLAIDVVFGGTTIAVVAATDAADNDIFTGIIEIHVRSIGASGTFTADGIASALGASGTATGRARFKASTAVDTTAAFDIGVQATWSAADANTCRLDGISIQLFRQGLPVTLSETTIKVACVSNSGIAAGTFNASADIWARVGYLKSNQYVNA